ncbi:MAG: molybdenum cofactor biosynthesis protein [Desulfobacterales bacterium]|nr:MAG: molybdenum cofactor biosynthesis protein [Desulfobacterales bacterium]
MSAAEHRKDAITELDVALLTLSTTRSLDNDPSGNWMAEHIQAMGHRLVERAALKDNEDRIREAMSAVVSEYNPHLVITTGGTGAAMRDVTIEAVRPLFSRELPAFSVLFAHISYKQIGSAAILSRSMAGVIDKTAVFCLPGSINAVRLACEMLIFPEMGHLARHIRSK